MQETVVLFHLYCVGDGLFALGTGPISPSPSDIQIAAELSWAGLGSINSLATRKFSFWCELFDRSIDDGGGQTCLHGQVISLHWLKAGGRLWRWTLGLYTACMMRRCIISKWQQ